MRGRRCLVLLFLWATATASAQDVHFSQLDFNPLLLNPAYSGFIDGGARVGAAYRTQWASVSYPFQTFALTADGLVLRDRYRRNGLGLGGRFYRDKAGTLDYGTTSVEAMAAYNRTLDWSGVHHLSLGVSLGYHQLGYDVSQVTLYDEGETLDQQHRRYLTVGAGVAWSCEPDDGWWLRVGLAAHNLNQPSLALLEGDDSRLAQRWLLSARWGRMLGDHWLLSPVLQVQRQQGNNELCYGADVRWLLGDDDRHHLLLGAGLALRHADAAIISLMAEYNALQVIFCYDANTSSLSDASSGYGAVELGVGYRFVKSQKKRRKALPCPIM